MDVFKISTDFFSLVSKYILSNYSFNVFSDWDLIFTTYTLNKTEEINICIFVKMEVFRFDVGRSEVVRVTLSFEQCSKNVKIVQSQICVYDCRPPSSKNIPKHVDFRLLRKNISNFPKIALFCGI